MRAYRRILWTILLFSAAGRALAAGTFVWIEAEKFRSGNFKPKIWDAPVLSAGKWLTYALSPRQARQKTPAEGWRLRFEFTAPESGSYDCWARVGYEWVRTPFEWRVDAGSWRRVGSNQTTTSLMEVARWCEVAWARAGRADLRAGRHQLEIRWLKPAPKKRLLIGLDCIAFVKGPWTPEGALKPGERYDAAIDQEAREHVFRMSAPAAGRPGARVALSLGGLWQVARYDDPDMDRDTYEPIKALPDERSRPLRWMGFRAPGDARKRPELRLGHRLLYRCRVDIPRELAGRSFFLRFDGTNWIASVFVNGRFAAARRSVLVPWEAEVTRFIEPGRVNTIVVGIKSPWYAADPKANRKSIDETRNTPVSHCRYIKWVAPVYPSTKGEGNGLATGLVNSVALVAAGAVRTADVFVRPSVAKKRLDADVTLLNSAARTAAVEVLCEAVDDRTGRVEKTFPPVSTTLAPGARKTIAAGGEWEHPKLWWPEDPANVYRFRVAVRVAGRLTDVSETLFGFRELSTDGKHFLLNGVRWHFWNWVGVGRAADERQWLAAYRAQKDRFHRISADSDRLWGSRRRALEFFDRHGVPGRLSTCIDGMFITHDLNNPLVWDNFAEHVRQVVLAYRNHPSIMMWSLGNEVLFVTAYLRHFRQYREMERRAAELSRLARELDPTRLSFQDGAGDLGGLIGMNCQHYSWRRGAAFPACAYDYEQPPNGKPILPRPRDRNLLTLWDRHKPLILGEVFYYADNPDRISWFGGPRVYRSMAESDLAAARYARIAIEGARWQDATAICPWVRGLPGADKSFAPRAVFVREHNSCFAPGAVLRRTIKVFNDTRSADALVLQWRLVFRGREAGRGEKTYQVAPGRWRRDVLQIRLPAAAEREDGRLELALLAGGRRVFEDSKPATLLPDPKTSPAGLDAKTFAVFDPAGAVRAWLRSRKIEFASVSRPDEVPASARVLLVGPDAWSREAKRAWARKLRKFVLQGRAAVVLRQRFPLEGKDLPLSGIRVAGPGRRRVRMEEFRDAGGQAGCIAFPVAPAHPAFQGLHASDFFTWAGDETVFRLSYATPAGGAIALLQAGAGLGLTPVMEIPAGQGAYLLCQACVAEKLNAEPVARVLLHNLLAWAGRRGRMRPKRVVVFCAGDRGFEEFLKKTGLRFESAASVEAALAGEIAVVRAAPAALRWLARRRDAVRERCRRGAWLMLAGLDAKGLASFNQLVGFRHRLRKFGVEAVRLVHEDDPLLLGLSDRDFKMYSEKMIAPWQRKYWVSSRVFSAVVDGEEIASFGHGPKNVTNGLTNEDFWRYIQYINSEGASFTFRFGRPETITAIRIKPTAAPYYFLKDVEIVFDDDRAHPVRFTCRRARGLQDVPLKPRRAATVTFRFLNHYPGESARGKNLMGVDLIEIWRRLPAEPAIIPLTRPAGIVKYPIGKGGVVLNQLDYAEALAAPGRRRRGRASQQQRNAAKKMRIYASLLRNLGAAFELAGR